MNRLTDMERGSKGRIVSIRGDKRFASRITSIGLTIGNDIEVVKNETPFPLLIYGRDTLVAVNNRECRDIMVQEAEK